jgi:deoxyribodipyrimidine photo-lyase
MNLIWFRNDLRLTDNPALHGAAALGQPLLAVVVLTPDQWQRHGDAPRKLAFWRDALQCLANDLAARNIALRVLKVDDYGDCAQALLKLCREVQAQGLYFNYEYPLNERRRDREVKRVLRGAGLRCEGCHGDLLLEPGSVQSAKAEPFKVFTPFSRVWRREMLRLDLACLPAPLRQAPLDISSDPIPPLGSPYDRQFWPVGEEQAAARLYQFAETDLGAYGEQRDFPALAATSSLSSYLNTGQLSVRQCLNVAQQRLGESWLESQWVTELIWREFYRHLLVAFTDLNRLAPFRPEVEARIQWQQRPECFAAWCRGETGFPIVDAAMRQLLATGWMHNRLRMVTASFLTKLLGVDWRLGAEFFMQQLIDGDFASNLGGWQWSASVGADAAPYFRIFSPLRQAQRFDPRDEFVCHWLPELSQLPARQRQDPVSSSAVRGLKPIIDYPQARAAALASYKASG